MKKTLPRALVEQSITRIRRQKKTVLQSIQESRSRATPHPVEKAIAEFKRPAEKNLKEDRKKFASSLKSNTPINQAWIRVRQSKKSKHP